MSEFYGGTGVTPMLIPDLSQDNPNRSDFVKNKHIVANAIKGKASGEAIRLEDVSPFVHEVDVKLSGGTDLALIFDRENSAAMEENGDAAGKFSIVTEIDLEGNAIYSQRIDDGSGVHFYATDDFKGHINSIKVGDTLYYDGTNGYWQRELTDYSTVTLTKYGKNLLNRNATSVNAGTLVFEGNRQTFYRDDLNDGTARGDLNTVLGNYQDFVGKTITISYDFVDYKGTYSSFSTLLRTDKDSNSPIMLDNGKQATFARTFGKDGKATATYTIPKDDTAKELILRQYVGYVTRNIGDYITIENLQVEIGDTVTDWEEYKEPITYTPNADGTIDGVTSLYPTTILTTDTEGVNIEAEYSVDTQKYIDKKFAELQALVLEV